MFGPREDEYLTPSLAGHQVLQQICLTRFVDRVNSLINAAYRGIGGCDLNFLWLMQELACQRLDLARERGKEDRIGQINPVKRYGQPSEISEAACFLLSDRASYVNGQALPVDGGLSASHPWVFPRT